MKNKEVEKNKKIIDGNIGSSEPIDNVSKKQSYINMKNTKNDKLNEKEESIDLSDDSIELQKTNNSKNKISYKSAIYTSFIILSYIGITIFTRDRIPNDNTYIISMVAISVISLIFGAWIINKYEVFDNDDYEKISTIFNLYDQIVTLAGIVFLFGGIRSENFTNYSNILLVAICLKFLSISISILDVYTKWKKREN